MSEYIVEFQDRKGNWKRTERPMSLMGAELFQMSIARPSRIVEVGEGKS